MTDQLHPNSESAIGYLLWINPEAPIYLERMESAGPQNPKAKSYPPHDADSAKRFISANNGPDFQRNIYYMPNSALLNGKRSKANVSGSGFLWADLDCKDYPGDENERRDLILTLLTDDTRRPRGVPAPSAIVYTGGGYQALWKLDGQIQTDQAESLNKALLEAFGGAPGPVVVSQLLRLPGTVNWLSDTKRADGREPALAFLIDPSNFSESPKIHSVEAFKLRIAKDKAVVASKGKTAGVEPTDITPLPLPDDLAAIIPSNLDWVEAIVTGENPPGKLYPSRSELVFGALRWMLGNGVQPGHALAILLDPNYGIGAHVREQGNALRYGQRQIVRALMTIEAEREDWPEMTDKFQPVSDHPANIRYALARLSAEQTLKLHMRTSFQTEAECGCANREMRTLYSQI